MSDDATQVAETTAAPEASTNEGQATSEPAGEETLLGATEDTSGQTEGQGDKPDEAEAGKESDTDSQAEPFKLTVPDEFKDYSGEFESFGKDMGDWLSANPDATPAQALQEAAVRQAKAVADASTKAVSDFNAQVETWATEAQADPEIGGDGFKENLTVAKRAIDAFGDDTLKAALNASGMGNHPAVIRMFMKVGKTIKDADVVGNSVPGSDPQASLKARYSKSSG